jgi:AraC-like DNA-binding protein
MLPDHTLVTINANRSTFDKCKREAFLKRTTLILEKYGTNCDFNVSVFADKLCMSTRNVHRKCTRFYNLKPTALINDYRMKVAINYINAGLPILQSCSLAGFNNYSNFLKIFKLNFGCVPTRYED